MSKLKFTSAKFACVIVYNLGDNLKQIWASIL